ncbi:helix-turn-helix transcriptional regulator [Mesorhizobium denitrificans]|uniref:helix-turn-helix transcriptional regulator n=2 Tax=Mesorhizobium TaxID=68287 RepID=UPI001FE1726F|nr:response regulator transcription factor [Mesorhizobium denitrificans]
MSLGYHAALNMSDGMEGILPIEQPPRGAERADLRRTLMFVSLNVSDSIAGALEREFPWVAVQQSATLDDALGATQNPVSLILVDQMFLSEIEANAAAISRRHPYATLALMQPDPANSNITLRDIMGLKAVRSILPMNLQLDVWLSVVRLLLSGGEYLPPAMVHAYASQPRKPEPFPGPDPFASPANRPGELANLTNRETQILALVSQGLQNKAIAAECQISEHTVKIHLHNIISKLGSHNRTEAAARFRSHFAQYRAPANTEEERQNQARG